MRKDRKILSQMTTEAGGEMMPFRVRVLLGRSCRAIVAPFASLMFIGRTWPFIHWVACTAFKDEVSMKKTALALLTGLATLSLTGTAWVAYTLAANPSGYGQPGGEFNIRIPRVPSDQLEQARGVKPPFEPTPEIIAEGQEIYHGRGTCFRCHGPNGKGDGTAATLLPIQPRNFTNPRFKKLRTPGELMWVLKNGSLGQSGRVPGTGMLPIVGQFLSEEDGWKVLFYELSLGKTDH